METFMRSDLAAECGADREGEGIRIRRGRAGECDILRVQIRTEEAARRVGKPIGCYITVDCGEIFALGDERFERVRCALSVEIRDLAERMCGRRIEHGFSVLVAGLGNRDITADAVGPETVRRLSVTRHLKAVEGALFSTVGLCEISALIPGVTGQTGLETVELVRGAVTAVHPDLVVAVDALAARSEERLMSTVQLSDAGIQPGAGIGNRRGALCKETVGVPVMALGVPTVVDAATLACNTLRRAGYTKPDEETRRALEAGRSYFVSPKEIDLLVSAAAVLLAGALEKAFSVTDGMLI